MACQNSQSALKDDLHARNFANGKNRQTEGNGFAENLVFRPKKSAVFRQNLSLGTIDHTFETDTSNSRYRDRLLIQIEYSKRGPDSMGTVYSQCLLAENSSLRPSDGPSVDRSALSPNRIASFKSSMIGMVTAVLLAIFASAGMAQEDEHKGVEDFDKATELKHSAKTLRDLDEIANLCRSAIKKGLDKDSKLLCESMLVDSLMLYGKTTSGKVLSLRRDRRWRFLRQEGLKRLNEVVSIQPKNKDAWFLIAKLNIVPGGDREMVESAVETLIEISGDDKKMMADALLLRSTITTNEQDRLDDMKQAIELAPEHTDARRARGIYFFQTGRLSRAIEDFQFLVKKNPKDTAAVIVLAEIYYRQKEYKKSLKLLEKITPRNRDYRVALLKANVFVELERFEEAVKAADEVLKIDSRHNRAWLLKVRALMGSNKYQKALDESNGFLRVHPTEWRGRWYRSAALAELKEYDKAIEDVQAIIERIPAPGNGVFMMQLGGLYNASDRPRLAIKHFTEMLDDYPGQKTILRSRGDAYLAIGKHKEAIQDYKEQLDKTPEDFGTLNNLAWVLSTSTEKDLRDGKKAIEYAEKACKLTEYKKPYILSTLASSYAEVGDFKNAMKWIDKAREIAEKEKADNLEDIKKELEFYKQKKPWREKEDTKEKPLVKSKEKKKKESKDSDDSEDDF